jgi:hypothetical protein
MTRKNQPLTFEIKHINGFGPHKYNLVVNNIIQFQMFVI